MPTHAANAFMDQLVTTLKAIGNGQAKWATTQQPRVERTKGNGLNAEIYPYCILSSGRGQRTGDRTTSQTGLYKRSREVDVEFWFESHDFDVDAERVLHDIELAIGEDATLNGTCRYCYAVDDARALIGGDEPLGVVVVTLRVMFATENNDPATAR